MSTPSSRALLAVALCLLPARAAGQEASAPEPTPEERRLTKKFGGAFIGKLRALGVSARDFLYADKVARVGLKNLKENDLADAMYLFRKAHGMVKSPNVLLLIARTYEQLGSTLKARRTLVQFLADAKRWDLTTIKPEKIAAAEEKLRTLERQLVALSLAVQPAGSSIFVNGELVGKSPHGETIWLMPGTAKLVLSKKGYVKREVLLTERRVGARITRRVRLLTPQESIRANRIFKEAERKKRLLQQRLAEERRAALRRSRIFRLAGYSAAAVGLAAVITGGILGGLAEGSASSVEGAEYLSPWTEVADDYDRYEAYRTGMYTMFGIGGGLVAAGAALAIYGHLSPSGSREQPVSVTPLLGARRIGLAVRLEL